ncbi:hypothetical protein GCM10017687_50140 [Streptomyces echinatus]
MRTGQDRHVLLLTAHRIIADRASLTLLERELAQCYTEYGRTEPARPVPYAGRATPAGEAPDEGLAYWKGRLDGLQPLDLPLRPAPAQDSQPPGYEPTASSRERGTPTGWVAAGPRGGVPAWTVPAAAFAVLLARWTGRYDVVFRPPRRPPPPHDAHGAFVPTRTCWSCGPT